jgi:hypothetical protein
VCTSIPRAADPPQRPDQPDVSDGVRELPPPRGLEVWQQVELASVYARWQRLHAGTTQSGSPQPSDRGITCAGSTRLSVPQTTQQRPATAAR